MPDAAERAPEASSRLEKRLYRGAFLAGVGWFAASLAGGLAFLGATRQLPGLAPDPLLRARELLRRGQFRPAIGEYRSATTISPDFNALLELSFALAQVGDPIGEGEAYEKALSLRPSAPVARLGLAWALVKQGRLEEAVSSFRQALELDSDNALAHAGLGEAWLAQEKFDDAIASLSRAAELTPGKVAIHTNLGKAFLLTGRFREAVEEFSTAYRLAPVPELLTYLRRAQELESGARRTRSKGPARDARKSPP